MKLPSGHLGTQVPLLLISGLVQSIQYLVLFGLQRSQFGPSHGRHFPRACTKPTGHLSKHFPAK